MQFWTQWSQSYGATYFEIFDEAGNHSVKAYDFTNDTEWSEYFSDAIVLDNGTFAVFTQRTKGSGIPDTKFQFEVFDSTGQSLTGEIAFASYRSADVSISQMQDYELNADGNFVALHYSAGYAQSNKATIDLDMLVFDQQGHVLTTTSLRSGNEGYWKIIDAKVTNLDGGGWVVTWGEGVDFDNQGFSDLRYFQVFDEGGAAISQKTLITGPDEYFVSAIYPGFTTTALAGGGFVVSWLRVNAEMDEIGPFRHVWMQRAYDADGNALTKAFQINDTDFLYPVLSVEALDDGGWLTTFVDGQMKEFHVGDVDNVPISYDMRFVLTEDEPREFYRWDFMYLDPDGDEIAGIRITDLPEAGEVVYNGSVVKAGDFIPWADVRKNYGDGNHFFYRPPKDLNGEDVALIGYQTVMGNGTASNEAHLEVDIVAKTDVPTSVDFEITIKEDSHPVFNESMFEYGGREGGEFSGVRTSAAYVKNGTYGLWTDFIPVDDLATVPYRPLKNEFGDNYTTIMFQVVDNTGLTSAWYEIKVNVEEVMDTTRGTDKRDVMTGIEGSNKLIGGKGNDVFRSGAFNDIYVGGKGRDTFEFMADGGADVVKDFQIGSDIIDVSALSDVTNMASLRSHLSHANGNVTIHFSGRDDSSNVLVIEDVRIGELGSKDFEF